MNDDIYDRAVTGEITREDIDRHIASSCIIHVEEPRLHLSQGSWLRVRRDQVAATIANILEAAEGNVKLRTEDCTTAALCRHVKLMCATHCPVCRSPLSVAGFVSACPQECFLIVGSEFYFKEQEQ